MALPGPKTNDDESRFLNGDINDNGLLEEYEYDEREVKQVNNNIYCTKGSAEIKDMDGDKREVAIYLSKFDHIDSDNDMIRKGAFKKSLKERGVNALGNRKIQFLRHHDWTKQIGTFVKLEEDDYGLFAVGKLGTSTMGEDAWRDYKEGIIREHSIGYQLISDKVKWIKDASMPNGGYNLINEVVLFEGSAVTFGSNEMTNVIGVVKGQDKEDCINRVSDELNHVIAAISNGKGSDERLYSLEMKAKYLSSQLTLLAKAQPLVNSTDLPKESMVEKEFNWNEVINYLKI